VNRKKLWFLVLTTIVLASLVSGCIGGGQFGAPSTDSSVTIKGVVVAPDNNCFTDTCANPSIIEGDPLPNADIILKGDTHTLTGKTDCAGNYQISGLSEEGYVLYAIRGKVIVKKAISPVTGDGGEANYHTTAQVILWEVVENAFPGSIPIKDIPFAIPFENIPEEFDAAVKAALADCRDAQNDKEVLRLARNFALTNFGAPCAPCVEPSDDDDLTPSAQYTLSTLVSPEGGGTVSGGGTYNAGETAQVTATPAEGYQFDHWEGDLTGNTNPGSILMNSNKTVTAVFTQIPPTQYTLTTAVSPVGGGTVSGGGTYNAGETAQVTATPAEGYQFDHWEGDLTGNTNPGSILMNSNKTVTAVFTQIPPTQYTLTTAVSPVGGGTVSGGGTYNAGETAQVTATPAEGYQFDHWEGDLTGNTNPGSILMNSNKTVTAVFTQIPPTQYTLTTAVSPVGGGTVSGGGTYNAGETAQVTATPAEGYQFDHWEGDLTGNTNPGSILMNSNKTVTAVFTQIPPTQYTLTTAVSPVGGGTVSGGGTYNAGETAQVTATPAEGYQFDHWEGDLTGNTNPGSILMNSNKTVTAVFTQIPPTQYTLTTAVSPVGGGTVSGGGTYNAGETAQVTATPAEGYQFDHWEGDLTGNTNPGSILMNGNKTVTAVFTLDLCCELVNRFSIQRNYWGYKHFEWKYYFKGNIEGNPCRKWLTVEIQLIKDGVVIDSDTKTAHGNNFDTGSIVLDSGESDWGLGASSKRL
jgi:hypothetical protein